MRHTMVTILTTSVPMFVCGTRWQMSKIVWKEEWGDSCEQCVWFVENRRWNPTTNWSCMLSRILCMDVITPYINQCNGSTVSLWIDAKAVLELRNDDVDGSTSGVASHQWFWQVCHHKTKLDQAKKNLEGKQSTCEREENKIAKLTIIN